MLGAAQVQQAMMLVVKDGMAPKRDLRRFSVILGLLFPAQESDIPAFLQSWLLSWNLGLWLNWGIKIEMSWLGRMVNWGMECAFWCWSLQGGGEPLHPASASLLGSHLPHAWRLPPSSWVLAGRWELSCWNKGEETKEHHLVGAVLCRVSTLRVGMLWAL